MSEADGVASTNQPTPEANRAVSTDDFMPKVDQVASQGTFILEADQAASQEIPKPENDEAAPQATREANMASYIESALPCGSGEDTVAPHPMEMSLAH